MPTIRMKGGLGNQLFQYAVGRHISERTGYELYLDIQDISKERNSDVKERDFLLGNFNIKGKVCQGKRKKCFNKVMPYVAKKITGADSVLSTRLLRVYIEKEARVFSPEVLNLPGDILLEGYFQSEKYFGEIREIIKSEINLVDNIEIESYISNSKKCDRLAVHVRRGDYEELGWTLPLSYYRKAIKYIDDKEFLGEILLFSDNAKWVQEHKNSIIPKSISARVKVMHGNNPYIDLVKMSQAKHIVISNSTFGWWGAWLGEKRNGTVIAPSKWIHKSVNKLDIIPDRWIVK